MANRRHFDVIIIGGSYAGLSAAMALGRSLRNVLVIDGGMPCNRQTPHSQNFLTQDGEKPSVISGKAKAQVLMYETVTFHEGMATSGRKTANGFVITTEKGEEFESKKLVLANGIKDILPGIKGFAECWGTSAVHCPYCHGYEFRYRKTGLMANGDRAFHLASLIRNLTEDLTILTSGKADFNAEQMATLEKHKIKIVEEEIAELEHTDGYIKNVVFNNGRKMEFAAVYAVVPFIQHSDLPVLMGVELTEHGYIKTDHFHQTSIDGIYACGDNSNMMRSVANAVYAGNLTGALINKELADEKFNV